jgi:hypothetical protein
MAKRPEVRPFLLLFLSRPITDHLFSLSLPVVFEGKANRLVVLPNHEAITMDVDSDSEDEPMVEELD